MSHDILLSLIDADPNNARKTFDDAAMAELAASIKASGLAVPILLRPIGDRYIIVHGERRYRAVRSLGWPTIPADVRDIDAEAASWLGLVENVQRADLSPIEEAHAYQTRLSAGITQGELGRHIGKSQSYIATKLRLLKLPEFVQAGIRFGKISEGHAKQLLRLDCPEVQHFFTCVIVGNDLSVLQVKERVDRLLADVHDDLKRYSEAWNFSETLRTAPDNSDFAHRYGKRTNTGWTPPQQHLKDDWLFGLKMIGTIWKVNAIIAPDDYDIPVN
jgi:ParB family chromosome partitioning protein